MIFKSLRIAAFAAGIFHCFAAQAVPAATAPAAIYVAGTPAPNSEVRTLPLKFTFSSGTNQLAYSLVLVDSTSSYSYTSQGCVGSVSPSGSTYPTVSCSLQMSPGAIAVQVKSCLANAPATCSLGEPRRFVFTTTGTPYVPEITNAGPLGTPPASGKPTGFLSSVKSNQDVTLQMNVYGSALNVPGNPYNAQVQWTIYQWFTDPVSKAVTSKTLCDGAVPANDGPGMTGKPVSCILGKLPPGGYEISATACYLYQGKLYRCTNGETLAFTSLTDPKAYLRTDVVNANDPLTWDNRTLIAPNRLHTKKTDKVIGGYYELNSIFSTNAPLKTLAVENVTHIYDAFLYISTTNNAKRKVDEVYPFNEGLALSQNADPQDYVVIPGVTQLKGVYGEYYRLKKKFPQIKIIPSVGGANGSAPFYTMAADPNRRQVFVRSVLEHLNKYDFTDGIDLDWEYPGVTDGSNTNASLASAADGPNFVLLLQELRKGLDDLQKAKNRADKYELHIAVGASSNHITPLPLAQIEPLVDHINLMSYDYYGAWNTTYGHHAGLYRSTGNFVQRPLTTDADVTQILGLIGSHPEKLSIGYAGYGRGWEGIANGDPAYGPLKAVGTASGGTDYGTPLYKEVKRDLLCGAACSGYSLLKDPGAFAEFVWNQSNGTFITLDTPFSVKEKAAYVKRYNLGGIFTWTLTGDDGDLLNAVWDGL